MSESEGQKKVSNNDLRNSQFGGGLINAENVNAGRIGGDILNIGNVFIEQKINNRVHIAIKEIPYTSLCRLQCLQRIFSKHLTLLPFSTTSNLIKLVG
jgi:hypothetical protein